MTDYIGTFETYLLTQKRVSRNTLESYMLDILQFNKYLTSKKIELKSACEADIADFFSMLRKKKKLAARSLSRKISSLKIFYVFLGEKFGFANITLNLVFPKLEKKLPNFLTEAEVYTILDCAQKLTSDLAERNNILLKLLYVTGIRISEATNLKLSDINFEDNLIMVQGKGNKERLVPIPADFSENIKNFVKNYQEKILKNKTSEYLFAVKNRGRVKNITRQAAWFILKKIVLKSGVQKRVTPHTLRHSLATHLLEKGANLRSLQVWLGHENLSTVEIYTHVNTEHLRKVYDKKHPRSSK